MLAKTARLEKLLDDLARHVANAKGLNRNLCQCESSVAYFAAILQLSSFVGESFVRKCAEMISASEKTR